MDNKLECPFKGPIVSSKASIQNRNFRLQLNDINGNGYNKISDGHASNHNLYLFLCCTTTFLIALLHLKYTYFFYL